MRRRGKIALAAVGALAIVGGSGAGIAVAISHRTTERERSRDATDRDCRPPYVELEAEELDKAPYHLDRVGHVEQPSVIAVDPAGRYPTLLGEREGRVVVIDDDGITTDAVLDLDDTSDHGDGGLLGLTYDPDEAWLYVLRSSADQDDVVTAYPIDEDGRPDQDAEVELLRSGHGSSEQHHGGSFVFGPDGDLHIGFGDGGGLGDPRRQAQDGDLLLGKLLRIDPTPGGPEPYAIPPDNPFVGRDGWRPEIWAYGVRNPFRLSVDTETGDIWLGDVGQSCFEELDRLTRQDAGANLGWDRFEGTSRFQAGDLDGEHHLPEHTYSHLGGWCAVVNGYVIHDADLPDLDGWLLHSDYCKGRVMAFRPGEGGRPPRLLDTGLRVDRPIAIFPGPDGLPWILSLEGDVERIVPSEPIATARPAG